MTSRTENPDVEALKEELASLRADVAMLVEAMKKNDHSASESTDKPTTDDTDTNQWDELKAKVEQARNQSEDIRRELGKEVRKHPLASVAISFGIGYLVSKLIK